MIHHPLGTVGMIPTFLTLGKMTVKPMKVGGVSMNPLSMGVAMLAQHSHQARYGWDRFAGVGMILPDQHFQSIHETATARFL